MVANEGLEKAKHIQTRSLGTDNGLSPLQRTCNSVTTLTSRSTVASFPGPPAAFSCTKERNWPGTFPHVSDAEGRKTVEIPKMNMGVLGPRTARRANVILTER